MPLLTKSSFKLALECPTKLYYHNHADIYANSELEDLFLQALADGGFQVSELAKKYYPADFTIRSADHATALHETANYLKQEEAVIHEAAFGFDNKYFVKADIVRKKGNHLDLIEVKAKSFRSSDPNEFIGKNGGIVSSWKEYIYDLTFQYWVIKKQFPDMEVTPYLLLADKDKKATIDGLNQMFRISRDGVKKHPRISCTAVGKEELGEEILSLCDMTSIVTKILGQKDFEKKSMSFEAYAHELGQASFYNIKQFTSISKSCKKCQFIADPAKPGLTSGFVECWKKSVPGFSEDDITRQKFYDVWNLRKDAFEHKYFLDQLEQTDIDPDGKIDPAAEQVEMTAKGRQWEQIRFVKEDLQKPVVLKESLKLKLKEFVYPLHFIDFETMITALPFNKGIRPYEMISFQFSHHIMYKDGTVEHADEWINTEQGAFPNFKFVRAMKAVLDKDSGTIFRYAAHENTVLNKIKEQLEESQEEDRDELIAFIETITYKNDGKGKRLHTGERNMVDICDLVRKYYLHPLMKGSNSIKKVLPAVLNDSAYLQQKYGQPEYGSEKLKSKNYQNMTWIKWIDGKVVDPYKLLDPFFDGNKDEILNAEKDEGESSKYVGDGGAAMVAYAEMQFSELPHAEVQKRIQQLKRYCELDTLAMVMIMEEFINLKNKIDEN